MKHWITGLAAAIALLMPLASVRAQQQASRPIIVLVRGAFAGSGSWNGVIERLRSDGYTVFTAPNPLRGVASDAAPVAGVVNSVQAPVLVGRFYGGPVITVAAAHAGNVNPSWFVYGTADLNIPPAAHAFVSKRAGAKKGVVFPGASHVVMTSSPKAAAALNEDAAAAQ